MSERFRQLQRTNRDIVAWLSGGMLDLAVVQRDNEYYLRRDYTGKQNANGAIFLDESISLLQRPDIYILYGHNMKTGAMFGSLQRYSEAHYLRHNGLLTFDTQYEDGQFVIFAVGEMFVESGQPGFVPFYTLIGGSAAERDSVLRSLQLLSSLNIPVDVLPEDQILLLVTCTGDDASRRFVAARRIRDNETVDSFAVAWQMVRPQ